MESPLFRDIQLLWTSPFDGSGTEGRSQWVNERTEGLVTRSDVSIEVMIVSLLAVALLLAMTGLVAVIILLARPSGAAERLDHLIREELGRARDEARASSAEVRQEVLSIVTGLGDGLRNEVVHMRDGQKTQLDAVAEALHRFEENTERRLSEHSVRIDQRLEAIRQNNDQQLESMRATVDEKLNDTLEKRLGESFRQVSERLEQVHKGLGEMNALAMNVGDLKKVLSNVKMRGGWGEVQLESLLEQMLAPDQYVRNLVTRESSRETVEFAVKFPGKEGDGPLYLPLDAKFPLEDYQRLVDAIEAGDRELAEACARDLERRIRGCAKDIREKYINPPVTTDFAIMFLPVEGLYAEVLRRAGLADQIQRDFHVMIAGPTTLMAILSSLQMGFHTLAIEKRSSEVWQLLAAVKTQFGKFGGVLAKVKKSLDTASDRIDDVSKRSTMIEKRLKTVETLPDAEATAILQIAASPALDADIEDDESTTPELIPDSVA